MFESNEDANAFMSGSGFAANPIGVEYDPHGQTRILRAWKMDGKMQGV
jgi:hypothetical protein